MDAPRSIDFDAAVLGGSMPAALERALQEAGTLRDDPVRERAALLCARSMAPDHPAVLIACYRSAFYGHRLDEARGIARHALAVGTAALGFADGWRALPARALPGARFDAGTRFVLFALKGLAYLSLRLGDDDEARDALDLLRVLDPEDRVGASVLDAVRRRAIDGDPEDEPEHGSGTARSIVTNVTEAADV